MTIIIDFYIHVCEFPLLYSRLNKIKQNSINALFCKQLVLSALLFRRCARYVFEFSQGWSFSTLVTRMRKALFTWCTLKIGWFTVCTTLNPADMSSRCWRCTMDTQRETGTFWVVWQVHWSSPACSYKDVLKGARLQKFELFWPV